MSRKQIKLTFQIGYNADTYTSLQIQRFERGVADAASRVCGGCTTSVKRGYWKEDGEEKKDYFTGNLETERAFQLELTCEPHKADRAYDYVKIAIARYASINHIYTDWVHVTETEMVGRHFSVTAINAPTAA